jgi:hypothetical protein
MEQRADRAFRLSWEFDHMQFYDGEYEMELHEFPDWEKTNALFETTPYNLPETVVFEADFEALSRTDYPTNNVYWPVMSRRMYYTLLTVGDFSHRVIPVAMVDDTSFIEDWQRRFSPDGQPNPTVTNFNDFVAVQLLEESDYFDFDHSEYEWHPRDPNWVHVVSKYVLNEPSKSFPPLFRLKVQSPEIFISAQAREALKEAGIRGISYYPLDSLQSEVDIPVQLSTYP